MAGSIYKSEFKSAGMHCLQLRQSLVDLCKCLHLNLSILEMFNLQSTQIFTVVFKNEVGSFYVYIVIKHIMHFRSVCHLGNKECVCKVDTYSKQKKAESHLTYLAHTGSCTAAGEAMYIYK